MERPPKIDRRTYLKTAGSLGTGASLGVTGCVSTDELPSDDETPTPTGDGTSTPGQEAVQEAVTPARTPPVDEIPTGGTGENFELVGHNPLLDDHQYVDTEPFGIPRGSNGDVTVVGDCVYVGSLIGHQPPLIVDVADPTAPEVVGPVPDAVPGVANGVEGIEASGDVLVIAQRRPLGGLGADVPDDMPERGLAIYDISTPREPELVARHDYDGLDTHALTLWRDPKDPERLLGVHTMEEGPNIKVVDLSGCPGDECDPAVVAEWDLETQIGDETPSHEAVISADGSQIYVAQYGAGVVVLDSSPLMDALRNGTECDRNPPESLSSDGHCLTPADSDLDDALDEQPELHAEWHHTAIKVPDRPYVLAAAESRSMEWDEGTESVRKGSCPGAVLRLFSIDEDENTLDPDPVGVFGIPEQEEENCNGDEWVADAAADPAWLSPHFPLAFHDIAFSTYYSAGIRAFDISDPSEPVEAGHFFNEPVEEVRWASYGMQGEREVAEDGTHIRQPAPARHMFAFSNLVVHEGYLIYVDVHSGLYVLEYDGPYADQLPAEGTCLPANPGAIEPGYEPCPPHGRANGGSGE